MPHSYLGREDLKAILGDTRSVNDASYRRALEAVAEQIDQVTNRTFRTVQGARYFTPLGPLGVDVDDLLSVTAVRLDQSNDRTYGTTLSTRDYELEPFNAPADRRPYDQIVVAPNGGYRFSRSRRSVRVDGSWGYWSDAGQVGARLSSALDATSTAFTLASSTTVQAQQTVLIGSEQIYLNDLSSSGLASVDRAVNGTTGATHSTADTLSVYRYPAPIVEAARIQASRLYKRRDAPLGVQAAGLDVTEGVVQIMRLDPDVEKLLENYRRFSFLAV